MKTEVVLEKPAFTLHGSSCAGPGDTTEVSYDELRQAEVGQMWDAFAAINYAHGGRNRHEENAMVVYKDDDGIAVLFRTEGTTDEVAYTDWRGEPTLKWFEFCKNNKKE